MTAINEAEPSRRQRPFNPLSQDYNTDPAGYLREAQEHEPVFYSEDFGCWVVTRYEDARAALLDHGTFSNATLADAPVPEVFRDRVPVDFFAKSFNAVDPPEHTSIRRAGQPGFRTAEMNALAGPVREAAHALIDEFEQSGSCELMKSFCHAVTHRTIATLMALPAGDIPRLQQLAEDLPRAFTDHMTPMPENERLERWERIASLRDYFGEIVAERRQSPGNDFVSLLIRAADPDGRPLLSDQRIITHMTEMVFAGTDTTANLIAHLVILFDQHPDQLELVRREPERMPGAVEEGLRVRGSVNGLFRRTTRGVEIAGQTIPANSQVYLAIASAGQDPARFPQPTEFDISRPDAGRHVSFGAGRHLCLGAPLARLEADIALSVLYERLPALRVVPGQSFDYDPILLSVMLKTLYVQW
jgi:cytochrome P450